MFLQNLRDDRDAIREAALAMSNPLAPKIQDGHGCGYVHPLESPTVGPMLHKNYHRLGEELRGFLRKEAENFLVESCINHASMEQQGPEHYRSTSAQSANVDEETKKVHDTMYHAYKKMGDIDNQSVWTLQDQGAAEINIGIISAHMKKSWTSSAEYQKKQRPAEKCGATGRIY